MNLRKKFQKSLTAGFTLIELLVVVAIIGILASVVLASLNSARNKGNDAAVKSNLDNMRAQSAIYYDTNNSFNTTAAAVNCTVTSAGTPAGCTQLFADPTILAGLKAAASASGATVDASIDSTGNFFAIDAALKATAGTIWCVDAGGKSEQVTAAVSAMTSCP